MTMAAQTGEPCHVRSDLGFSARRLLVAGVATVAAHDWAETILDQAFDEVIDDELNLDAIGCGLPY
jgi:hypothetical protein